MNAGIISRNVGIALICEAAFMLLSAACSAFYNFDTAFSPLLLSGIVTLMAGLFPIVFVRRSIDISFREGLAILLLAWLCCCLFGMMPYLLWGGEFNLVNAWFESTSGITTTGATILADIESLPRGLLLWRSSTHYIGGLGVVVFMMMILPSYGTVRFRMSRMDMADVSRGNYRYVSGEYVRVLVIVYLGITIAALASLLLAGMPLFDAVNHTFSVTATGGFSTRNASIAAYDSPVIECVLMFFMIVATLHFGLIYASFASRSPKVLRNPVTKFYLGTILVLGAGVAASLLISGVESDTLQAVRKSFFEVVSTISTTGFAIVDTNPWPPLAVLLMLYAAIQCGCAGSTTSGLRSDRVLIVSHNIRAQLIRMAHPNSVVQVKTGDVTVDSELVSSVSIFVLVYGIVVFLFACLYACFGFSLLESVSCSVSMMSNVGPAFGRMGSVGSFADVPAFVKTVMGLQMIIGRLGFYSVLILFSSFGRKFK